MNEKPETPDERTQAAYARINAHNDYKDELRANNNDQWLDEIEKGHVLQIAWREAMLDQFPAMREAYDELKAQLPKLEDFPIGSRVHLEVEFFKNSVATVVGYENGRVLIAFEQDGCKFKFDVSTAILRSIEDPAMPPLP